MVIIRSFGFKYGIPTDSGALFDVRFLPNPYYVEELKHKSGSEREVQEYVMSELPSEEFLSKLSEMVNYLAKEYEEKNRGPLVVSIGCTGGRHRSVTIANRLYEKMSWEGRFMLKLEHRDKDKED